jgi:hypothetical protein
MHPRRLLPPLALLLLTTLASPPAHAEFWVLRDRPYFDPVVADPRAAMIKVLFPAVSKTIPFAQRPGTRLVWDVSVGKEIPIVGYERHLNKAGTLVPGSWGVGLWFPIGFHILEDFKDDSAPPVDTDYRFAPVGLKVQYAFAQMPGQGAWRLGFRFFGGHESTHLGDEFVIHARNLYTDFERINVSYQWADLTLGLERDGIGLSHVWSWKLQAGTTVVVFSTDNSYYTTDPVETGGFTVAPSHNRTEPYVSFEGQWMPTVLPGWGPFLAVDARLRNVYNYDKVDQAQPEDRQPSFNVLVGARPAYPDWNVPDIYLRGYYGVNPAGQFRSQRDYWLAGIGFLFHP